MTAPLLVTGTLTFDAANHDRVVTALRELTSATRAEPGNISYVFAADLETPGVFHVTEQWASQEAFDEHNSSPHMSAFMAGAGELGATGASVTLWSGATATKLL